MHNESIPTPRDAVIPARDLPLTDSVALQRLIAEVRQRDASGIADTTLYNRTYHRHNR
ncbi:hypothetical protein Sj15T_24310 [Sphingobium sp. TA15]|uniref:Uncharacterized protein n=1 Tax=Sphingobium indicum (strain DSM 16413 / CCM 7287 / MTCC 6362 / UT26 / NBRC 101211 / UT26S) TaxID=452662 RepID=D4Z600_SPHIU|nr:YhhA family cyclophane-containing RiPP [Sphingobium indicum]BAI98032.1 hypothetical protein SJA_C1-31980 [Sphingobium indicum UT26S]BDD67410.1 hypothetical protein Sj15T_24310 [Sphingobium sp. TA15]